MGVIAGVLAVPLPYFAGLTEAMAGLGVAATAVVIARGRRAGRTAPARTLVVGLVVAFAGWIAFALAPDAVDPVRALVLGLASVPLGWWAPGPREGGTT